MRAFAAALLTMSLLATGCSADPEPGASDDSPSVSPSPSVTPAPEASPTRAAVQDPAVPNPPRGRNDRRGREAFAEYVLQAWIYALNTNDPQPLVDVSGAEPCGGCRQLQSELEDRAEEGWYVALEGVRVASTRVPTSGRTSRVLMSVNLPESDTFYDDGRFRSTNPAHPRSTFEVEMTYTGKRFRLDAFSLY